MWAMVPMPSEAAHSATSNLTLHNHLGRRLQATGFSVRFPNRTSKRWEPMERRNRLPDVYTGLRIRCGAARKRSSINDRRTRDDDEARRGCDPREPAARPRPQVDDDNSRPQAGCDGHRFSERENASASDAEAMRCPDGRLSTRRGFAGPILEVAGDLAGQHELVGRETAGGPQMIGSLDTRPLSVSLSCGTSADRARLAAPGTRT
jgi:hypothetical protein